MASILSRRAEKKKLHTKQMSRKKKLDHSVTQIRLQDISLSGLCVQQKSNNKCSCSGQANVSYKLSANTINILYSSRKSCFHTFLTKQGPRMVV